MKPFALLLFCLAGSAVAQYGSYQQPQPQPQRQQQSYQQQSYQPMTTPAPPPPPPPPPPAQPPSYNSYSPQPPPQAPPTMAPSYSQPQAYGQQPSYGGSSYGGSASRAAPIPIMKYSQNIRGSEQNDVEFESGNGIRQQETTRITGYNAEGAIIAKTGSFSYTSPEGIPIHVSYSADEQGFKAEGAHLPTPPPMPEEIRATMHMHQNKQAGGSYGGQSYQPQQPQRQEAYKPQQSYQSAPMPSYSAPAAPPQQSYQAPPPPPPPPARTPAPYQAPPPTSPPQQSYSMGYSAPQQPQRQQQSYGQQPQRQQSY